MCSICVTPFAVLFTRHRSRSRSRTPPRRQRRRPTQWDVLPEGGVVPSLAAVPPSQVGPLADISTTHTQSPVRKVSKHFVHPVCLVCQEQPCTSANAVHEPFRSFSAYTVPAGAANVLQFWFKNSLPVCCCPLCLQVPGMLPSVPAIPGLPALGGLGGLGGLGAAGFGAALGAGIDPLGMAAAGMAAVGGLGALSAASELSCVLGGKGASRTRVLNSVPALRLWESPRFSPHTSPVFTATRALTTAAGTSHSQQATRHARRVYVGGLPPTANETSVSTFFSHALAAVGGNTAGPGERQVGQAQGL
jgi:hypothetical protein